MYLDRIAAAASGTELLTRGSVAARQWEQAAAAARAPEPGRAWLSLRLASVANWLAANWEAGMAAGAAGYDRRLLSPNQTRRLWQRVIAESDEADTLLGVASLTGPARAARSLLYDYGLEPADQGGALWSGDCEVFLRWNGSFDRYLASNGWVDPESLLYRSNRLPLNAAARELLLLDPRPPVPEWQTFEQRWRQSGRTVEPLYPDSHETVAVGRIAREPAHELELAADWAARRLAAQPTSRLAIVVPDLAGRRLEVETVLQERCGGCFSSVLTPGLADIGICGAAASALGLLRAGAGFGEISRWLRSPFFTAEDEDGRSRRAGLERWLRQDPRSASGFIEQFQCYGLREEFRQRAPATAGRLEAALALLPRRGSPTVWAGALQRYLRTLGWTGFQSPLPDSVRAAWDGAWSAFAELTAVTGSLTLERAIAEFEAVLARQSVYRPLRINGIHVLRQLSDIGPGYAGAWVTGFSDLSWPLPAPRNPFLPWPLRRRHAMPGAIPELDRRLAMEELERLTQRTGELIFSCPERIRDQPQVPNPAVGHWCRATPEGEPVRRSATGPVRGRLASRRIECLADPAPPMAGRRIPGGTGTLRLQSECPAVAFAVARLKAEPVEPPTRGIDARRRGLLLHRALELCWRPAGQAAGSGDAGAAIAAAAAELLPGGDPVWRTQVEAESRRLQQLLDRFGELEQRRAPFSIIATEQRIVIEIDGYELSCRIDRVDQLPSGRKLLIDYKSGGGSAKSWFEPRLGDCQLPVYALHDRTAVDGIAIAVLNGSEVEYRAAGRLARMLPGRQRILDAAAWEAQLDLWRRQIELLIAEFVAGDVRVNPSPAEGRASAFAALTRSQEHSP